MKKQPVEKMICRILLLLILTSCVSGSFVVNVTQTSYQAEENHNITLEWTFSTEPDMSLTSVHCYQRTKDKIAVLYHSVNYFVMPDAQDKTFSGRVQSDKDALREGRIRLQLSRLRTDDSGLYICTVFTNYASRSATCELSVIAAADQLRDQL